MALLNKLFKKEKKAEENKTVVEKKIETEVKKSAVFLKSLILISPFTTEKALFGQNLNKYIFKVLPSSNKIEIAKEIKRTYGVLAVSVNIINIPKKARRVGRTLGFKAGYKKAVVTLAKGQSIEIK